MFEFLKEIPKGWRFYSCDWSISGRCSITFVRTSADRKKWHLLSEEQQDKVDLYVLGQGSDFGKSFLKATEKCLPIEEDYQI